MVCADCWRNAFSEDSLFLSKKGDSAVGFTAVPALLVAASACALLLLLLLLYEGVRYCFDKTAPWHTEERGGSQRAGNEGGGTRGEEAGAAAWEEGAPEGELHSGTGHTAFGAAPNANGAAQNANGAGPNANREQQQQWETALLQMMRKAQEQLQVTPTRTLLAALDLCSGSGSGLLPLREVLRAALQGLVNDSNPQGFGFGVWRLGAGQRLGALGSW